MNLFNTWPERQAHLARWALLLAWLGLIGLLLWPSGFGEGRLPEVCSQMAICRPGIGNDLFWNLALPLVLLCVVASHELWRRICPLSFVSQLFRALGLQRTVATAKGRRQLVAVDESSWLGRHHVQLQWSLLIAGLVLRILVINSDGLVLALLFIATLLAALVTGWAYSGKAWCQYLCPFGVAQQVLTGPRSLLGSNAHMGSPSRTTQSMCRAVGSDPQHDISTCVACVRPCVDIDAERNYWHNLIGQRGLNWAWYSYPGLILGFFLLIYTYAPAELGGLGVDYLRSRLFSFDGRLAAMAWQPFLPAGWPSVPRLVAVPVLLSAACLVSQQLFQGVEQRLERRLQPRLQLEARPAAVHRCRLLATFAAVNTYFFFKGNPFSFTGRLGDFLFQLLIVAVSAMWLYRGWHRDRSLYDRENTSTSLRRQLAKLGDRLKDLLGGRQLDDLSAGEVFVLAKALPAQASSERRQIYSDVLRDMLRHGRLDRASAMRQLDELRSSLGLEAKDHAAAIELLIHEDQRLAGMTAMELRDLDLRRSAAAEEIEDLLHLSERQVLHPETLPPTTRQRLERIRTESGLDDEGWAEVLESFGPSSAYGEQQLGRLEESLRQILIRRRSLEQAAGAQPLVRPLLISLDQTMARLLPSLVQLVPSRAGEAGTQPAPASSSLALLAAMPATVMTFLASEDATTVAIARWLDGAQPPEPDLEPLPRAVAVVEELCQDSDPAVAAWSLETLRRLDPALGARLQQARPDLPAIGGSALLASSLMGYLEPAVLLQLPRLGQPRQWGEGEPIALPSDSVLLLLEGDWERAGRPVAQCPDQGQAEAPPALVGLLDYLGGAGTEADRADLRAGAGGCRGIQFSRRDFRELLDISPILEQMLIKQLARTCGALERQRQI